MPMKNFIFSKSVLIPFLFIFCFTLSGCDSSTVDYTHYQQCVKDFENSIKSIDAEVEPTMEILRQSADRFSQGTISTYKYYSIVKIAKDIIYTGWLEIDNVKIDKNLPDNLDQLLEDCRTNFSTAYFCMDESLKYLLNYLDNHKPSDLYEYKNKISSYNSCLSLSAQNLVQAQKLVGINNE